MIENVEIDDLPAIKSLIEMTVSRSIDVGDDDRRWLITDILRSLDWWLVNAQRSVHLKFISDDRIVGVLLMKKNHYLSNLFVHPDFHRRGIGGALLDAAIAKTPNTIIKVNSSAFAVDFYLMRGFRQTGPSMDRPGGSVPMERIS